MELTTTETATGFATVGGVPCDLLDANGRLVITPNALTLDGQSNIPADLRLGESLADFLARHVPGIESGAWAVSIGGHTVPRAMWSRTWPKHGQLIACRCMVQRAALQIVAIAVLSYFTMGAGAAWIGGAFGVGAAGAAAIGMGMFMAGSMLINKVLAPKVPKAGDSAAARDVYSLSSQRNSARAYEPLPVLWGEMRVTPDLASQPYAWYEGDNQYLGMTLLGGVNVHSVADLSVGETDLSQYLDVQTYLNGFPGHTSQDVPLSGNVDSIAGAELPDEPNDPVTRTTSAGTVAFGVDLEYTVFHQGHSGLESAGVQVVVDYAPTGTGAWVRLHDVVLTGDDTSVRRISWQVDVPAGQYDVRVQRSPKGGDDKTTRNVTWTVLKSIQPDATDYSAWGRIGIKIKATGQLSGSLDTLRATYRARPIPVWNGAAWVTAATRDAGLCNPGAIILQTLRGVYAGGVLQFGFGLQDAQIDIEGLKAFMLHCAARGYTYDRWITGQVSLGAFCDEVALAGMGQFTWTDGSRPTVSFVGSGQPIGGVVNMANMLKGSFSVAYNLSNVADGIEYQYLDRNRNWETQTLRVAAPGVVTMLNPARISGDGVTTEAHAAVMARYHLAQSLYQYKTIDFGADIEHLDYRRLSVLSLSHDMTQWGFGGRVVRAERVASAVVLQLDEPVPSLPAGYIGLRVPGARDYRVFSVQAFSGETDTVTLLGSWPADLALPGEGLDNPAHDTLWCYDFKATPGYRVRVVSIEPEADLKGARVSCVPEGPEFWDYVLNGTYTPAPNQSSLPQLGRPKVSNLRVTEKVNVQGDTEWYELGLIWDVAGDYDHAQVWAGRDGSPPRLVEGNAAGSRSQFRIDGAGQWLIQVIPFNPSGQAGEAASVVYGTHAVALPPSNPQNFVVFDLDGGLRRYAWSWSGNRPNNFAGVQIRYVPGDVAISAGQWDSMTPLGAADDIYTAHFETMRPEAGLWTFGLRAINTSGQLSPGIVRFAVTLSQALDDGSRVDLTPPPDVTGLKASAMFTAVLVEWDAVGYDQGHGHARTIIYAAQGDTATFAQAAKVAEAYNGPVSFASEPDTVWKIWAKNQTVDGVESVNAAGPVQVRTAEDVAKVLDALHGKIAQDQLVQSLGQRINLIDGTGAGSVDARILAEAAERNALLSQEAANRTNAIAAEQQQRAAADTLEAQTRASALAQQAQNLGNAVVSLTEQIQDGDGALSQRIDSVVATNYSRPNLVAALQAWTLPATFQVLDLGWGEALYTYEDGTEVALSPAIPAFAGAGYVLTYDSLRFADGGSTYMDLQYFDADGLFIGESDQVMRYDVHDFREDDQNRLVNAHYAVAPAGTSTMKVRAVTEAGTGVSAIGWRQPKLERGSLPATRYSSEAQASVVTAALRDERSARIAADSAEAQQRSDLAVQLRGNATGSDLGSVTSGLVAQERNARVAADNSLAYQMSMLSAGVGEQFDTSRIWYFDTEGDPEGWGGTGPLTVTGGFMRLPDSTGFANFTSPNALAVDANTYRQVKMRIRKQGAPVWVGRLWWRSEAEATFDLARSMMVAEPAYDANGIALVTWEPTWTGTIHQINFDVFQEQQPGGWFEIDWVAMGRPSPGASVAMVIEEQTARAAADNAEADSRERLSVSLTGLTDPTGVPLDSLSSGMLAQERNARVSADNAEVIARQNLATTVSQGLAQASASLQAEQQTRASADSAASARMDTLSATIVTRPNLCPDVDKWSLHDSFAVKLDAWGKCLRANSVADGTYVCVSPAIPCYAGQTYTVTGDSLFFASGGSVYLDLEFHNANGDIILDGPQRPLWTDHDHSTSNVNRDAHAVSAVAPAGAVSFIARFVAVNVVSCQAVGVRQVKVEQGDLPATIYTQEGEVGAVSAALQVEAQTRADQTGTLFGRYSVKIDLNGYVTGYGLLSESNNGANTSTFAVRADRFVIGNASDNAVTPFVVEGGRVYMNSAVIKDATIKNAMIENGTIQSAKIANLTVDKIASGYLQVGNFMASSGYQSGAAGWAIWGNGNAEFNSITVRGTVYATAGQVGGIRIAGSGLAAGSFTGYGWPAYGGSGFYLGPEGMLIGNNNGGANGWLHLYADGRLYAPGFSLAGGNAWFSGSGSFSGDLVANTFSTIGGRFTADASGRVVADRVDIRRREVIATGSVYWGRQWIKDEGTGVWDKDLETGWLVIDTGIDASDYTDFSLNQPFHAIASCTATSVSWSGNLGANRAFELLTSVQTALSASHYAYSGSTPGQAPRIKLLVRVPIVNVHSSVYRIRLDNFNWSLFRI